MIREKDAERFLLLKKGADLVLNELAHVAGEKFPETMQRDIRSAVGAYWASMSDVAESLFALHPSLRNRDDFRSGQ